MCENCGCQTDFRTSYTCSRCGESFCIDCRLPEYHNCTESIPRKWSNYVQNVKKLSI
ncbi:MAG: AN1-type zinc finger domain-containing protein [Methanosarcina flavescens]|nr:hypothetical protein AOB57_001045 [Methanosarcina flavescens]